MTLSVILARQRSGTGALGTVLDQHPNIKYMGEVFHHDKIDKSPNYFWFVRRKLEKDPDIILPDESRRRFEAYTRFLKKRSGRTHTVIDVKYSSTHHFNSHWLGVGEPPSLFKILSELGTPILHLMRTNYLKVFVSGRLAEINDIWHARKETEIKFRSLTVDTRACIWAMEKQGRQDEQICRILKNHPKLVTLNYEELFDDSGALKSLVAEQLSRFFDVSPFERLTPVTVKQTSDKLRDVLENFDEVAEALRGTPYAWMLSD